MVNEEGESREEFETLPFGTRERLDVLVKLFTSGKHVLPRPFLESLAAKIVELTLGEPLPGVTVHPLPPYADLVDRFLFECCEIGTSFSIGVTELHEALRGWCSAQEKFPPSKRAVALRLEQHGFLGTKRTAWKRFWVGLRIREWTPQSQGD